MNSVKPGYSERMINCVLYRACRWRIRSSRPFGLAPVLLAPAGTRHAQYRENPAL